jgi:septal ring factor EnvC (AmiA/AmiB activator)
MRTDAGDSWQEPSAHRRFADRPYPRRPWALIAAALLLALLSAVLWAKWSDSRDRAERLQAELRQVYAEAEAIRLQATRAQQRIGQLEREVRALEAERAKAPAPPPAKDPRRPRPR